jgi:hypothetical protein
VKSGQRIDPLIHYAGRVNVSFTGSPGKTTLSDLKPLIDRTAQTVRSSTRELSLDYGLGLLTLNAPQVAGASGNLKAAGEVKLSDLTIQSSLDNVHIVLVALDGKPLAESSRMLLQVMSEETSTGFTAEDAGNGLQRITNIGRDPWRVKALQGKVRLRNEVKIQPLDFNGYPAGMSTSSSEVKLAPNVIYYLLSRY